MALEEKYNQKNPAVKRLMREACELKTPTEEYYARPLDDNLFEWHFTVHGSPGTDYGGGVYHGRILLPPEYPMKPPNIILLTPNGRFETNKKICLSISGHHPETWQPSWSIRTALLALIAFMSSPGRGSIGALDYTPEERKKLAKASQSWQCDECGPIVKLLSTSSSECPTQNDNGSVDLKTEERVKPTEDTSSEVVEQTRSEVTTPSIDSNITLENTISQDAESPNTTTTTNGPPFVVATEDHWSTVRDYLLVLFVAALALLIARRMAITMFL